MGDTIIVTTKEVIERIVHDALHETLLQLLPKAIQRATTKPYLTKPELMELTGWSSRQIEYKKSKREIPFIRRRRLILFPTEEIHAYLEEGRISTRKIQGSVSKCSM